MGKRKREDDGGPNGRKGNPREDDGGGALEGAVPADEEVDEFFAILKRIQVAVKYFKDRDDRRRVEGEVPVAAPCWSPAFQREDFEEVKTEAENSEGSQSLGLDLNSDPVCDVSDLGD